MWVPIPLQSLKLEISRLFRARSSLTFKHLQSVDSLYTEYVTMIRTQFNWLRNKKNLEPLIRNHFDIFLVSETKLDSSFPGSKFTISGYRLLREDRNQHGGGSVFYMSQNIPCKTIDTFNFPNSLEVVSLEINSRNKKIIVIGG